MTHGPLPRSYYESGTNPTLYAAARISLSNSTQALPAVGDPDPMRTLSSLLSAALLLLPIVAPQLSAESLPGRLQGAWRITRVLPTTNTACWDNTQARPLVGSTLVYSDTAIRWRGGEVPLQNIFTRRLTAEQFSKENRGDGDPVNFTQLGIHSPAVLEVDLQHEDMDITGATTEVPGDSVLMATPNRIVVQACGVFFEATRTAGVTHTSLRR